jgi:predicted Zn-dependent protease
MIRSKSTKIVIGVLTAIAVAACTTSPTGRKQLIFIPDSQMNTLGAQSFDQLKTETPVETDPKANEFVKCVASAITEAAKGSVDVEKWDIVVFRDNQVNAFALPGGKIGVYTGILPVTKTDAQLAAVLGHEVGHVMAKHGGERMSQGLATQGGLAAIGALTPDNPKRGVVMGLLGLGAQFGVLLPFGRTQETEADTIGINLMAKAGFNPEQSVELWKNMAAASKGAPPEFLSTHPSNESRISGLQSHMAEAKAEYEKARQSGHTPSCPHP